MIPEYSILYAESMGVLIQVTNRALSEDWVLVGGVATAYHGMTSGIASNTYLQAIVKMPKIAQSGILLPKAGS